MNEAALVAGCVRGDNTYRRQLYEHYVQQMMGICFRYTGDKQVSEDLLHDGFLKVFESVHTFQYRGEGSLKAWISRIFANISISYLRQHALREPVSLDEIPEAGIAEEDASSLSDDILMYFISELPEGYRTVLNLYVFEELSHKEIAEMMGINEASSRSQLSRAKGMLANKITAYKQRNEK